MKRRRALSSLLLLAFLFPGGVGAANRTGSKRVGGTGPHGKGARYEGGVNAHPGTKATRKSRSKKPSAPPPPKPPAAPEATKEGG